MGMAASQARLLSITSRMADNELRSQIINNSKMRLATESSRVSEDYINALNSATMMMSNYDIAGESQYQKLSFNSLTSYSSYNNQYGLVNPNGKLLVSENDAEIYRNVKNGGGDLYDFLAAYGLEYKSTFFTEDVIGGTAVNFEDIGETYTLEELEAMYYGDDASGIMSYNNALQSPQYINFGDYYNELLLADENYLATVKEAAKNDIFGGNWDSMYEDYVEANPEDHSAVYFAGGIENIKILIQRLEDEGKLPDSEWLEQLESKIYSFSYLPSFEGPLEILEDVEIVQDPNDTTIYTIDGNIKLDTQHEHDDGSSDYNVSVITEEDEDEDLKFEIVDGPCFNPSQIGNSVTFDFQYKITSTDEEAPSEEIYTYYYTSSNSGRSVKKGTEITDPETAQYLVSEVILDFKENILNHINRDAYVNDDPNAAAAQTAYNEALDKYIELIFGENLTDEQKEAVSANIDILYDPGTIITWARDNNITTSSDFEIIKQIYILDRLFEVYGEPKSGWVDVNNPNENADAKAQWYTNLYNRMEKGYSVILDGLASSNEWIQFALESGLVTIEQVDTENNWVSTAYTNCSDITEVTDNTEIAKAEAEYNKAMNNIENKDKRYDIELKNIDTEHNSLQTEYESVKSVIDKNIERSFKIYS